VVKVDLKGIAKVKSKGRVYFYAWRGGPRLDGSPGTPEFMSSYARALDSRKPADDGRIRALISLYRGSPAFTGLAPTTRKIWNRWLDRIVDRFGEYRVALFDHPEKIKPVILKWRDKYAHTPRTADYAMQVLSRVMAKALEQGKIRANPCEGIKALYKNDRSEIIWTESDLAAIKAVASPSVWHAISLAAHTGLRAEDLRRLSWSHISSEAIVIPTNKSLGHKEAFVPLYASLRSVLAAIPKRSIAVLTGDKGLPLKDGPNGSSFNKAFKLAFPEGRDLHFHDLRGTAATRFHSAGLSNKEIGEVLAWEEGHVDKIIGRYVGQSARTAAIIRKLNEHEART
jgi:integrase